MADVLVAIPTFRRPKGLARLLAALAELDTNASVEILVADNDAGAHAGLDYCELTRGSGYRWPLTAISVAERGIAQARNGLIAHALSHSTAPLIAMLDDDEWPEPGWLDAFLRVQRETGADALHGAVLRDFESRPGAWAERCQGIAPLRGNTGPVDMIHGTSNVIVTRACFERLEPPWFDPAFALTGGEDKEFFTRLCRSGARFAWADDAIVWAHVPLTRSTLGWALQRAYRVGNSDMRVFLKHERGLVPYAREGAKVAGAMVLSSLTLAAHAASPAARTADLCRMWRAAGKIAAMFGAQYNEYATVHGS
jgi:GT2 family glycosyltransferase